MIRCFDIACFDAVSLIDASSPSFFADSRRLITVTALLIMLLICRRFIAISRRYAVAADAITLRFIFRRRHASDYFRHFRRFAAFISLIIALLMPLFDILIR